MKRKRTKTFDPSRTTTLRRAFMADINRRMNRLKKNIRELIVDLDVFGLKEKKPFTFNAFYRQYEFKTNPEKVTLFKEWLQEQVDQGILEADKYPAWTNEYIHSAYLKGVNRAYTDIHKKELSRSGEFYEGSRAQFLQQAFSIPITVQNLQMIYTRAFDSLVGFTQQMSLETSRILATGLSNGWGASEIASKMTASMSQLTRRRAMTIARTEIIHAHAEGQLDSFEMLGVEELGIQAEWSTAGDERVCPECGLLEGEVFSIEEARGMIPLHPNCRCAWIPLTDAVNKRKGDWDDI